MRAVQRKPDAEAALQAFVRSPGRPLEEPVRRDMERELGHDLSRVRVFDEAPAAELAEAFGAEAFAVGQSVFFGAGRYRPRTPEGRELLRHELSHTVQQRRAAPATKLDPAAPEAEARADATEAQPAMPVAVARRSTGGMLDPAQLAQGLARIVARNLRRDPDDARGDVRRQLERLDDPLREALLDKLRLTLSEPEMARVRELAEAEKPQTEEGPKAEESPEEETEAKAEDGTTEEGKAEKPEDAPTEVETKEEGKAVAAPTEAPSADETAKREPEVGPVEGGKTPETQAEAAPAAEGPAEAPAGGVSMLDLGPGDAPADPTAVDRIENLVPAPKEEPAVPEETAGATAPESETQAASPETAGSPATETSSEAEPAASPAVAQTAAEPPAALETGESAAPSDAEGPAPVAAPSLEADAPPAPPEFHAAASRGAVELPESAMPTEDAPDTSLEGASEDRQGSENSGTPSDATDPEGGAPDAPTPNLAIPEAEADAGGGDAGGGGGCGGGGAVGGAPAKEEEPAPAVAEGGIDPEAVLAGVAGGTPIAIGGSLAAASSAAGAGVSAKKGELEANPPTMDRPTGAPAGARPAPKGKGGLAPAPTVERITVGTPGAVQAQALQGPTGEGPRVPVPSVFGTPEGKLSQADVSRMVEAADELPTTDPSLNVTATAPATLTLDRAADPEQADTQRANAMAAGQKAYDDAHADALKPAGEQGLFPDVHPESLSGKPCPGTAKNATPPAAPAPDRNVAALAESEKGDETRASIGEAQGQMAEGRTKQQEDEAQSREDTEKRVQDEIESNSDAQAKARRDGQKEVADARKDWTDAQDGALKQADEDGTKAVKDARKEIGDKKTETDKENEEDVAKANGDIKDAREKAEGDAQEQKKKADDESSGFFGWIADKVKSFFNAIKNAIKAAFNWARDKIKAALKWVRDKVVSAIEAARKWVVDKIRAVADAILAVADVLLAAFPELREKFHALVEKAVEVATNAVNKLADALKSAVNAYFDALMCAIDALLGILLDVLLAAIDVVANAVNKAIQFAQLVADGLGKFLALVADVAAGPGQWLSNLASSASAGIKNCLWAAFKAAVKKWFNDKVEEVVGVGKAIWNVLKKGIPWGKIADMAWAGIKAAIPAALISLVVEKLVSLLIPGAGAVLAVIQGLIAAYGAIQRILAALGLVFDYLKSVRGGGSPGLFAEAVAASAVAVIDFVANWLIARLAKGAGKRLAKAFESLAAKLGALLKKAGALIKKGAKKVWGAVKKGAKKVLGIVKKGAGKAWAWAKKTRLGKAVGRGVAKVKQGYQNLKDRYKKWRDARRKNRQKNADQRLDRAVAAIRPSLTSALDRGVSHPGLLARFGFWMVRYGLSRVFLTGSGHTRTVVAKVNPEKPVRDLIKAPTGTKLLQMIHRIGKEILAKHGPEPQAAIADQRAAGKGTSPDDPIELQPGVGNVGAMKDVREQASQRTPGTHEHMVLPDGTAIDEKTSARNPNPTPGTIHILGLGGHGSYPAIAKNLERMQKATGASEAEIMQALGNLQKGHPIPARFAAGPDGARNQRTFGALVRLFQVEGGRGDAAVLQGPMLGEMVKGDKMTVDEAFASIKKTERGGGGGMLPASQRGAVLGESLVAAEIGHEPTNRSMDRATLDQQRERQLNFAARFIQMRMEVLDMDFDSEDDIERYITKVMEEELNLLAKSNFGLPADLPVKKKGGRKR